MSQSRKRAPSPSKVALIRARWHADIVDKACESFEQAMKMRHAQVSVFDVPGAFEIPLLCKRLAQSGQYNAIVGAALVVDGGIYRHDFVANSVVNALMQVQLETNVPVFSMVLTPHHFHETEEHRAFFTKHFVTKGREAAMACNAILEGSETELAIV